jgi:hypothetical protein
MHPFLRQVLQGLGQATVRVGVKAGVAAIESALEDTEKVLNEAGDRVARTRKRARKIIEEPGDEP